MRLQAVTREQCPLDELFHAAETDIDARGGDAPALVYAPAACEFGVVRPGQGLGGGPESRFGAGNTFRAAVIAQAYEVRIFSPAWEARWLRDGLRGSAAVLWEGEDGVDRPLATLSGVVDHRMPPVADHIDQSYQLWGQPSGWPREADVTRAASDWVPLAAARIGTLWVPYAAGLPDKPGVALRYREYLTRGPHGNVVLFEQRLIGLGQATVCRHQDGSPSSSAEGGDR